MIDAIKSCSNVEKADIVLSVASELYQAVLTED